MIMQTGGNNKQSNDTNDNYNEQVQQEQYYEENTYADETQGDSKKMIIIGAIVVGVILLLLLFLLFGGKKNKVVDNNNNLKNIVVEGAELEPAFNQDVLEYQLKNASERIRITCQASSENATVDGCNSEEMNVADLTEDLEIIVKAANGEEKKYIIKVNEGYEGIKFKILGNDSEWSNKPVTLTVEAESENALADEAYSFDGGTTWQSENTKTYEESATAVIKVKDKEGNISASQTVEIKIDKDAKVLISNITVEPDDWTADEVVLTVDASSSNQLHEKAYSFDGGKTWQAENTMTFKQMQDVSIVVRDEKENLSKESVVRIKIDKTTPKVSISGSVASGKATTNTVVLRALTNNSPSGYKYQWYKDSSIIDGATSSNYTATASGSYKVEVTNGVGKTATSSTYSVNRVVSSGSSSSSTTTNNNKTSSGTVSINSVSGNPTAFTKSNVTLKVSASASKGLNSKAYSFDNGNSWQSSNTKTFSTNQTVYIKVRDKNGKTASRTVVINKIDKNAPVVSFSANGSGFVKKIDTKVTVKDNGIGKLNTLYFALSTSGSKKPSKFASKFTTGQTIRITNTGNSLGTYYLWIKATDSLGNEKVVVSKAFKIDNQVPSVPTIKFYKWAKNDSKYSPTTTALKGATVYKPGTWSNTYIFTSAGGSKDGKGVGGIYYQLTVTGKSSNVTNKKQNARNIQANGITYIKYRACDKLGNCSGYTSNYKIMFDNQPPKVTFSPAKAGSYYTGQKIYAVCNDSNSGVTYMKTWFTQDSKVYRLYNSVSSGKVTHNIAINVTGSNKSVTTLCKDAAGNSTGNKVSPKLTIKAKPTTSSNSGSSNSDSGDQSGGGGNPKDPPDSSEKCDGKITYNYYCASPYTVDGKYCIYIGSSAKTCPKYYSLKNSKCVSTQSYYNEKTPTYSCPIVNGRQGTLTILKQCSYKYEASYNKTCQKGYTLKNGKCCK